MTKREFMLRCGFTEDELPPPDPPGMTDEERHRQTMARLAEHYRRPTLEDYREAYRLFRIEWPGDDEVRRLHPILATADGAA